MDPLEVADRLFAAIEAGDLDTVTALYAPDAVIWHNHDGVEQSPEENLRTLGWVVAHLDDRRYEVVRRSRTDDGFVQQHVLHATNPAGDRVRLAACIVACVDGQRIKRLDEYLDSAQLAPFVGSVPDRS